MKKWKQRLIMLLCAALIAPSLLMALPMFTTQVQAGQSVSWHGGYMDYKAAHPTTTAKVIVEQGQNFILGDWITVYNTSKGTSKTAYELKGVKYSSSNKKIASISNKGVVNTKKKGTTKITVKVGGETLTCTMKVVKKRSLTKKLTNSAKVNKELAGVRNLSGAKINDKNFDKLFGYAKTINNYCKTDYYYTGKQMKHYYGVVYYPKAKSWYDQMKGEVAMPQYLTYVRVRGKMANYLNSVKAPNLSGTVEIDSEKKTGQLVLAKPLSTAQYLKLIDKMSYSSGYTKTYYDYDFSGTGMLTNTDDTIKKSISYRSDENEYTTADIVITKNSDVISFSINDNVAGTYKADSSAPVFKNVQIVVKEAQKTDTTTATAGES